jgi:beta-galactosidase
VKSITNYIFFNLLINKVITTIQVSKLKLIVFFCFYISISFNSFSQKNVREDILLNNDWTYATEIKFEKNIPPNAQNYYWAKIAVPHNLDAYDGYRRLLHGNQHGDMWYRKIITIVQPNKSRRNFLFFEGVGSYAKIYLNEKFIGEHAGGRTTFTIDVTNILQTDGSPNELFVYVDHPANIKDLPWVCGGCSDERGFSEGSQPMGIFRPVHLIVTNDVRIEPFGVHAWADLQTGKTELNINTTVKNYSAKNKNIVIAHQLIDAKGKVINDFSVEQFLNVNDSITVLQKDILIKNPILWSLENPYLYKIISTIKENNLTIDKTETDVGFRSINFKTASHQFLLNDEPVFINGIAEYEHLLGQSHAFSNEQIVARIKWMQAAGFNALRDAHQPHNLLYGKLCNEKGMLWWTQFSAHVWYDTKAFRDNFKTLLREWVIERRNDPSLILWGLQNESKLPKDFAEECTALIRSLDPTASSQRLITTCNGGEGTDWEVPQNWTGTYGGDPKTYAADLKKQILVGEYGAWRTLDLHSENDSAAKVSAPTNLYSEDRMTALLETKVKLAEAVKDSVAGHFAWLLTSHDNPGRVQGGEGVRELDRIGPVNFKGLLTPWEEPTDAFYMYRSNYASKEKEPMVYIVSHTWPNRWMTAGIKNNIIVYSNCDEVELFNDIENISLGKQKQNGIGTHFTWNNVNVQYNVLYAVAYLNGKVVARDTVVLNHLQQSPNFSRLNSAVNNIAKPNDDYNYIYRVNCGGSNYVDANENFWQADNFSTSWTDGFENMPKNFASQRRTFSPIKNTKDWKLFQSFRYGKDKLKYEFELEDGDYLVELYFIEPWLGVGGGMNAKGMRVFDVAINNKVVLNDLDIWKEAGTNKILKKIVTAKVVNEKLIISFPESKVGQALISAITIAQKFEINRKRSATKRSGRNRMNSWLDIGDKVFAEENIQINYLPSNLFGASWFQLYSKKDTRVVNYASSELIDVFSCIKEKYNDKGLSKTFENTNTQIITDENGGTKYIVYRKRYANGDSIKLIIDSNIIVCMQPVTNMQPAYDLKPVVAYRPNTAKFDDKSFTKSIINEKETISFIKNKTAIEWKVNIGAADIYSLTVRYANTTNKNLYGRIEVTMTDGTVIKNEKIIFTPSKLGKWNFITTNTGSMINAGNYGVKIIADDAIAVGISGLDIQ